MTKISFGLCGCAVLLAAACASAPRGHDAPANAAATKQDIASNPPPRADKPLAVEPIADGKARVEVYTTRFTAVNGDVPCWAFITDGLRAFNHPDFAFALKREPGEQDDAWPREVLETLGMLAENVASGAQIPAWQLMGVTEGAFGRDDLTGMVTVPELSMNLPIERPYLSILVITTDELEVANAFGIPRVTSLLGLQYRFYPTAPWLDRKRASVVGSKDREKSILDGAPTRLFLRGASVWQDIARVTEKGTGPNSTLKDGSADVSRNAVTLELTARAAATLKSAFPEAGEGQPLVVLLAPSSNADARFVWIPGKKAPQAIVGNREGKASRVSGNFVLLLPTGEEPGATVFEDGWVVMLPPDAYSRLRRAIADGQPFVVPGGKDMLSFQITLVAGDADSDQPLKMAARSPSMIKVHPASDEENDAAQRQLDALMAKRSVATAKELFGSGLHCGPFLWDQLKGHAGAKPLGVPSKVVVTLKDRSTQQFESRTIQKPDAEKFAKLFVERFSFDASYKIRKLTGPEMELYWAMIPFDIEEPVFVVESAKHKLLVDLIDGHVMWIDDLASVEKAKDGSISKSR